MSREFEVKAAVRAQVPLLLGVAGCSGKGKTYSALRLATGMQRVIGGDIFVIDTESRRALHYADKFKFQHLDFKPPFGPLDYLAAIEHCLKLGAKILVIDSMTHEHNGIGGVMDRSEAYLDKKCGDNENDRQKNFMSSLREPKEERKKLNTRIVQLGINGVFCYRAHEKFKPKPGAGIENLGWTPETTSPLVYEMAARFLLSPGGDGKPDMAPTTPGEKMLTKTPEQFRGWFSAGFQLTEDLGAKMAEWARGAPAARMRLTLNGRQPRRHRTRSFPACPTPGQPGACRSAEPAGPSPASRPSAPGGKN